MLELYFFKKTIPGPGVLCMTCAYHLGVHLNYVFRVIWAQSICVTHDWHVVASLDAPTLDVLEGWSRRATRNISIVDSWGETDFFTTEHILWRCHSWLDGLSDRWTRSTVLLWETWGVTHKAPGGFGLCLYVTFYIWALRTCLYKEFNHFDLI